MLAPVKEFKVGSVTIGGSRPLFLIAGLCVIESEEHTLRIARRLKTICRNCETALIFKASYDKANRTSFNSYRGPGRDKGLEVLNRVKSELELPLLVDFHRAEDAEAVGEVADVLQVPAFLCRQTDIVLAAARTGRAVNIKKGQFLAPEDVGHIIEKIRVAGNDRILVTERGTSFGYHQLVNDMRALPIMRSFGYPVVFDATHSTQLPAGAGRVSGGQREWVAYLARAAAGTGCDGLFVEVHDQPGKALSDAASVLFLDELPELLKVLQDINRIVKNL